VAVVVVVVMVDVIVVVVKVVVEVEVLEAMDGFLCGGSGDSCCWSIPTDTPKSPPPPPTPSRNGRIRVYGGGGGGGGGGGAWPDAADSALPIVVRNSQVHSHMVPVFSFFSVVGFPRAVAAAAVSEF
jgi:hypothetical protein